MYQVLYYSRGGNTRKLADAIAGELGVKAEAIGPSSLGPGAIDPKVGVIFLGSGVYTGKPGGDLLRFIEAHDFRGRKVSIFSTSWLTGENAFAGAADTLRRRGATVLRGYHCKGKFAMFNRGHPGQEDLEGVRKFARDMAGAG